MTVIETFIQNLIAHPLIVTGIFAFVSTILLAISSLLQSLGATAPGWLGTVITWVGNIGHLINGNPAAVVPAAVKKS